MVTALDTAGGCWNSSRFAVDGAGADTRNFRGAVDTDQAFTDSEDLILCVTFDGDDMNTATGDIKVQWRNVSDSGSFADLAATGELRWKSGGDLTSGSVIHTDAMADSPSTVDCTTKGWSVEGDGEEQEGANNVASYFWDDDMLHEIHFAIDLSFADAANADIYEFRVLDGSDTYVGMPMPAQLQVAIAGKITGITKDEGRDAAVVSVTVSVFNSDGGSPAKPVGAMVAQQVSNGTTGAYDIQTSIFSGQDYFLHFYKDDTADLSDGSPIVTAVDA